MQDPEADSIVRKTATELCSLNPPRETTGRAYHRQMRSMRVAHSETSSIKSGPIKGMHAKGKSSSKVAHAEPAPPVRKSDIHAIQ